MFIPTLTFTTTLPRISPTLNREFWMLTLSRRPQCPVAPGQRRQRSHGNRIGPARGLKKLPGQLLISLAIVPIKLVP